MTNSVETSRAQQAAAYPASSATIALDFPFRTAGGETLTSVTLVAPTVRDRILRSREPLDSAEADVRMMARLCGLAYDDILNMEGADYLRLEAQFGVFLLPLAKRTKATS